MSVIEILLLCLPMGLSLAQIKLSLFGLPLYPLEVAFFLFIIGLTWQVKRGRISWQRLDRPLALSATLFVVGATLSTMLSSPSSTSLGQWKSWVIFPVSVFVLLGMIREKKKERMGVRYPELTVLFIGLLPITLLALYGYVQGYMTYDSRLAFPESSPNFLAFLVLHSILIASFFGVAFSKHRRLTLLLSLFISVALLVLYHTHSYNVFLAVIVSFFLISIYGLRNQVMVTHAKECVLGVMLLLGLIGGVGYLEYGTEKWQSLTSFDDRSSLQSRLIIWQSAKMMIGHHWFLGIGMGNFQEAYLDYQQYFPPYLEWAVPQPHNIFLALWLQAGLLGLLGFCLVVGRIIFLLHERYQKRASRETLLYLMFFCTFLLYGLFDTPYFRNDLAFLFWFLVWLVSEHVREE